MVVSARKQLSEVYYPESDGEPMAETEIHGDLLEEVKFKLRRRYEDNSQVQVGGNLFLYYQKGDATESVSPDVYVTFGIAKGLRRTYKVWEEGKAPDVIFEATSASTRYQDIGTKKGLYEALGVQEYFIVDPLGEYLNPPLRGFRLTDQGYVPLAGRRLESQVLGLRLEWTSGSLLLTDAETGEVLPDAQQEHLARQAADQRAEQERLAREAADQRAEQERLAREAADQRAEQERRARLDLEQRLRELEAKLAQR